MNGIDVTLIVLVLVGLLALLLLRSRRDFRRVEARARLVSEMEEIRRERLDAAPFDWSRETLFEIEALPETDDRIAGTA